MSKWDAIEDEIWAKVVCLERNRRVAKAYARAPVLTVNDSAHGFDGHRIGLNGFANPARDKRVAHIKAGGVEAGVKVRMDGAGNLLVKRLAKGDVFVMKSRVGQDQAQRTALEPRASSVLFDMAAFQSALLRTIKTGSSAQALQSRCFSFLAFGATAAELLNTPVWVIVINLVALEMVLKVMPSKLCGMVHLCDVTQLHV